MSVRIQLRYKVANPLLSNFGDKTKSRSEWKSFLLDKLQLSIYSFVTNLQSIVDLRLISELYIYYIEKLNTTFAFLHVNSSSNQIVTASKPPDRAKQLCHLDPFNHQTSAKNLVIINFPQTPA